jgi:hypothetical protein
MIKDWQNTLQVRKHFLSAPFHWSIKIWQHIEGSGITTFTRGGGDNCSLSSSGVADVEF